MTLSKILIKDNLTLTKYTLGIIFAYSTFNFLSKEKYFMKKNPNNDGKTLF